MKCLHYICFSRAIGKVTKCDIIMCNVNLLKVKGECSVFLKTNYIMHENDSLSEYNKIPLGHNRTNGTVYSKICFKVEICSTLSKFDSHPTLHFLR